MQRVQQAAREKDRRAREKRNKRDEKRREAQAKSRKNGGKRAKGTYFFALSLTLCNQVCVSKVRTIHRSVGRQISAIDLN